ncbi:MAG TPA: chemotaxis response regulator protein-glutamate methylesterase [Burkholderiaceae bacterium]|nr:chemotaxis response regulator protein-glutamate methylesterase [Burkholderiaceae bacterium]
MSIKVFVVDDSAVVRTFLADTLAAGGLEVVGVAADPLFAWPKMQSNWPDVVVLDVEMPRMDGISFLRKLMSERPTPVVMCSTLTEKGCRTTMDALAAGAVSFVTKPKLGLREFLGDRSNGLVDAVRAAARANVRALPATAAPLPAHKQAAAPPQGALAETTDRVAAIGISTGGVQSIEVVLRQLDRTAPGIVMVQHMPEHFTASFAARLNTVCDLEVLEARHGDRVLNGRVLIAPGGRHMTLRRSGAQYMVDVRDGPLINHHRPSVDVLFRSVAACAGRNALGLIMTGMGDDGARGLREMRDAGAHTAAQDEASCVVFGMPAEAIKLGAADDVVPLGGIAAWLRQAAGRPLRG